MFKNASIKVFIFVFLSFALLGLWLGKIYRKTVLSHHSPAQYELAESQPQKTQKGTENPVLTEVSDLQDVKIFLEQEGTRIGQIDPDPSATKIRLRERALQLNPKELDWLKQQTLNTNLAADQRFLAVFLLSLNGSNLARQHLKNIVQQTQNTLSPDAHDRSGDTDSLIHLQALEGLNSAQ